MSSPCRNISSVSFAAAHPAAAFPQSFSNESFQRPIGGATCQETADPTYFPDLQPVADAMSRSWGMPCGMAGHAATEHSFVFFDCNQLV
jgi:hypothetical protein